MAGQQSAKYLPSSAPQQPGLQVHAATLLVPWVQGVGSHARAAVRGSAIPQHVLLCFLSLNRISVALARPSVTRHA